ncbi:MAG TPA: hypothetical protein VMM18_06610 [Gemmatimonadaceae bacterium]|nr:hypothetical protein [Gemmatimonadaceae bacterium]
MRPRPVDTLLMSVVLAIAACASGTEPGPPPVPLVGEWSYEGTQTSPHSATLDGTLEVDRQSGQRFEGSLDVIESAAGGGRRLTGLLSGLAFDAQTVDFDVTIDGIARRHVAEVRGDSLVGTWAEVSVGGGTGAFHAVRQGAP